MIEENESFAQVIGSNAHVLFLKVEDEIHEHEKKFPGHGRRLGRDCGVDWLIRRKLRAAKSAEEV